MLCFLPIMTMERIRCVWVNARSNAVQKKLLLEQQVYYLYIQTLI